MLATVVATTATLFVKLVQEYKFFWRILLPFCGNRSPGTTRFLREANSLLQVSARVKRHSRQDPELKNRNIYITRHLDLDPQITLWWINTAASQPLKLDVEIHLVVKVQVVVLFGC